MRHTTRHYDAVVSLHLTVHYYADGSAETRYQYDQQSLLAETNAIDNTTARYHYSATQLISRTEAGSTPSQLHYLLDALNTPIALFTQEGAISARTRYDAWGEIVAQQGTGGAVITPSTDGANPSNTSVRGSSSLCGVRKIRSGSG